MFKKFSMCKFIDSMQPIKVRDNAQEFYLVGETLDISTRTLRIYRHVSGKLFGISTNRHDRNGDEFRFTLPHVLLNARELNLQFHAFEGNHDALRQFLSPKLLAKYPWLKDAWVDNTVSMSKTSTNLNCSYTIHYGKKDVTIKRHQPEVYGYAGYANWAC